MRGIAKAIILVPLALVAVAFAIGNRANVVFAITKHHGLAIATLSQFQRIHRRCGARDH